MSRAKGILLVFVVAACAAAILFLVLPRGRAPAEETAIRADGVTLQGYTEQGEITWEIHAALGALEESTGTLDDVTVRFHNENRPPLEARGDRLVRGASVSRLQGGVLVEQEDGLRLETEELVWDESIDRLAAGPVTVAIEGMVLHAAAFSYDLSARRAEFEGGVEAAVDRDPRVEVRADRAEERDEVLVLEGAVAVRIEGEGELACQALTTDLAGTTLELSGGVEGMLSDVRIAAGALSLNEDGLRARDGAVFELDLGRLGDDAEPVEGA